MTINKQDPRYRNAKRKVEHLKGFYRNLLSYVIFIGFLAGLNYYTNQWRNMWFLWAAFGWGIGLFFNALKVFNFLPFLGKDWENRKLKHFMNEDDNF